MSPSDRPSPVISLLLSCCCAGLGQLHCGRTARGLSLLGLSLLFAPLAVLFTLLLPSSAALAALAATAAAVVAVTLFAAADAYLVARRTERAGHLPGLVVLLLVLVGLTYPAGSSMVLRGHVLEAFRFAGASMLPNLVDGDRILVNKTVYRGGLPSRGDVVAFRTPGRREQIVVKRVVGLPGDEVAVRGGDVLLNGAILPHVPLPDRVVGPARALVEAPLVAESLPEVAYAVVDAPGGAALAAMEPTTVPPDTVFVLGDHRGRSADSRLFGFIPLGDILGRVDGIHGPRLDGSRFGRLPGVPADFHRPPGLR